MPFPVDSIIAHNSANAASVESDEVRGGLRSSVAGLDNLTTIPLDRVKPYATLVYVESEEKWVVNVSAPGGNGEASSVSDTDLATGDWRYFEPGGDGGINMTQANGTSGTVTALGLAGTGGITLQPGAITNEQLTVTAKLTDYENLTDATIPMWADDVDETATKFVNSPIVVGASDAIDMGTGTVTIATLNVTTLNATNQYTAASISTSDTFIRLADPTADPTAGTANETEYERAQHAGFVVNTGYYDEDFANTGDAFALSTHKLLYWNKTLLKWVVQDGTPEVNATPDPDTLINAENDWDGTRGRVAGTMKFLENFFVPDAQALHFGLNSIFSFNHFNGIDDPSVSSTTDKYMKTQYVVDPKTMFSWASFSFAADDLDGEANGHLVDRTWLDNDESGEVAANTMAKTYTKTARVLKAEVTLEGTDISVSGEDATIRVYHGGLFTDEIPMIRCYRKISGTVGVDAVYEEIMVRTKITDSTPYVEIIFNTGYLNVSPGANETNSLFVRMVA